jgi:DUF2075 family protein
MIVYNATKREFLADVDTNQIDQIVLERYFSTTGKRVAENEMRSWRNSMNYMQRILSSDVVPGNAGVAIEYLLPQSSKRIDFILSGKNEADEPAIVIIELKQWEDVEATNKDGIVKTFINQAVRETSHPSYQAWAYGAYLEDFNEAVETNGIQIRTCAYLHNCKSGNNILSKFYAEYTEKAPVFLAGDAEKLRKFISKNVVYGDDSETIYTIENGNIRPSKQLADAMVSLLNGNREFILLDEQKVVFETALNMAVESKNGGKNVLIVKGGPGTGKSVIAINLLVQLLQMGNVTKYISKNKAPRAVYEAILTGSFKKSRFSNLFGGTGAYVDMESGNFDVLIVDEAHRLNEKSGLYSNLGENQVKEIINSSKCSIFFLDEDQRVDLKDIGSDDEISKWAQVFGAKVTKVDLTSQFRCNGSDAYLSWLDNLLEIRETANWSIRELDYEVKVFETARDLRQHIEEKNLSNNKSRMVAGYCWEWKSKKDKDAYDIVLDDGKFAAKWNLTDYGSLWIVDPDSVKQIGCIHTCQGLELDYVGVIFGDDLVVRDGHWVCQPQNRARSDRTIFGYKSKLKTEGEAIKKQLDQVIKNTYRTLMTRGQKGCYLFSVDEETNRYLKQALARGE